MLFSQTSEALSRRPRFAPSLIKGKSKSWATCEDEWPEGVSLGLGSEDATSQVDLTRLNNNDDNDNNLSRRMDASDVNMHDPMMAEEEETLDRRLAELGGVLDVQGLQGEAARLSGALEAAAGHLERVLERVRRGRRRAEERERRALEEEWRELRERELGLLRRARLHRHQGQGEVQQGRPEAEDARLMRDLERSHRRLQRRQQRVGEQHRRRGREEGRRLGKVLRLLRLCLRGQARLRTRTRAAAGVRDRRGRAFGSVCWRSRGDVPAFSDVQELIGDPQVVRTEN